MCAELLQLLLLFQGKDWLFIGILGDLPPTLHLLRVQAPFPAVGAELGGVQAGYSTTVNLSAALQSSGSFSDAGTTSPCNRHAFLQL